MGQRDAVGHVGRRKRRRAVATPGNRDEREHASASKLHDAVLPHARRYFVAAATTHAQAITTTHIATARSSHGFPRARTFAATRLMRAPPWGGSRSVFK